MCVEFAANVPIRSAAIGSTTPEKIPSKRARFFPSVDTAGIETTIPSGMFCKEMLNTQDKA